MELLQLKYFKAVAETGKLSAAAEALFISAPALSASISRLEKELGTKLFDRTNNHLELNKQGEIFLKYANQVFTTLDFARYEIDQSIMLQQNHISIATTTSNMWTDLITAFYVEYSHFTLSVTNMRRFQLEQTGLHPQHSFLMAEEKDVPPSYTQELDSIVLFEDRLVAMIHPDHPLAQYESLDIRLLEKETLCYPTPGLTMYERLSRLFEDNNMPMPYGDTFPYLIYRRMAQEGLGISFTSQHISSLEPPCNLRYVPIANANPWVFRLYWRKNRPLTEKELLFKNFVDGFYHPD
ncbi:MAG: LysR family transcriptional regulator [Lachnospiraceae bacterium]|nr:LysR family transcriptional regulator [Lachnospiraceae bacterium]